MDWLTRDVRGDASVSSQNICQRCANSFAGAIVGIIIFVRECNISSAACPRQAVVLTQALTLKSVRLSLFLADCCVPGDVLE
jgi:hypothetical protein